MWNEIRFGLASLLMLFSLLVFCSGVLGVFRFPETLQRLHAAALNDTLGLLCALCSLALAQGADFTSLKMLLILVFLWIASPVSSHLTAQLEYRSQARGGEADQ